VIPRVGGAYGGETVTYDPASNTTYFYREGEPSYWSERLVSKPTYSVRIWDWNAYSPDPNNDAGTDSVRYLMAATPGFDSTLTVGPDGSIFNVNGGMVTLASGDSSELFYAIGFGTTSGEAIGACDSAEAKYKSIATSVKRETYTQPARTSLLQNYPNPFNPTTKIQFTIVNRQLTIVNVYDLMGREVARLVNEVKDPGTYTVQFDGSHLSSGMYYYRLESGAYTSTMKMLLVK
jgi:hypothetical protein